ncbi:lipid II:glycine glycyltransferase FemX [Nisaea sediminum]|uniref:lipid II:glycine glycyltransferase FemX n=1 Tax=Nisaea sediminum TaxID=2775867 RepID=UPI0018689581|nr:GNAT family N-acetyltransferase [Nisaea sediminum]
MASGAGTDRRGEELDGIVALWDSVDQRQWDELLAKAERPPLEQASAYGAAMSRASAYRPVPAVFMRGPEPVALALLLEWRFPGGFRIAKLTRGPVFLAEISDAERKAVFGLIKRRYPVAKLNLFFMTPELPAGEESESLLRSVRMRPMVTGYSTVWLDLRPELDELRAGLHMKWRNQLKLAEGAKFRVRSGYGGAPMEWLLSRHDQHRKRRRFRAPAGAFVAAIADSGRDKRAVQVFTAYSGSEPVAAILTIRHGKAATYYVGWTGLEGREKHAHNLLLWNAIEKLKGLGVEWLDLGGVDGLHMPGVSRFKLGVGGELVTLAGTYL